MRKYLRIYYHDKEKRKHKYLIDTKDLHEFKKAIHTASQIADLGTLYIVPDNLTDEEAEVFNDR